MSENAKNYFFWNRRSFEEAVKEVVCPQCSYAGEGECHDPDPRGCAIFRFLPDLVRIAQRMGDPSPQEYADAVRKEFSEGLLGGSEKLLPFVLRAVLREDELLESRRQGEL